MLLPRTTIRGLFWVITIAALLFFVARLANNGQSVAFATITVAAFVAAIFIMYCISFTIIFMLAVIFKALDPYREQPTSPFVDAGLPDQIIPPTIADAE